MMKCPKFDEIDDWIEEDEEEMWNEPEDEDEDYWDIDRDEED